VRDARVDRTPAPQVADLVLAVQNASNTGDIAAAVAAGLQARMRSLLSVSPTPLLGLVPARQLSAVVYKDLVAEAALG
jgi:hypothetical protein